MINRVTAWPSPSTCSTLSIFLPSTHDLRIPLLKSMDIEDDSDEYVEQTRLQRSLRNSRHSKRRKTEIQDDSSSEEIVVPEVSFEPLLDEIEDLVEDEDGSAESDYGFESVVSELLPEYLQTRKDRSMEDLERDDFGVLLRRLTRSEITSIIDSHSERADTGSMTVPEAIALRKLKVERERRRASLPSPKILAPPEGVVEGIENISSAPPDPETVDALAAIRKTPYESSFASRLYGLHARTLGVIYVDWDTKTPWMDLMEDIREHYQLLHPNRDPVNETRSAIMYTSLQSAHLDQVHDLLTRSFWQGIDVSDSLEHSPGKMYRGRVL
ncbi:hypothetical protein D9757_007514 [Collybiopsis confluens]|uniref:Uncharacterized protein n=1 Tax=Collybiopsis confluens TaxID=2823264 RepID=A0A8H5M7Z8_9AGAR|nr:hypothetical protein D9757_007514 [Collybiopsis confluens]